jgi:transcriptional regulator with XRE-family HTH domain
MSSSAPTPDPADARAKAEESAPQVLSIQHAEDRGAAVEDRMAADEARSAAAEAQTAAAEAFIAEKKIGERIKRLRLKRSMGLVELGRQAGLSASFLSQLETGRVVPTLRNLARIAMVFHKDLSFFFEPEPSSLFRVHRKADRVRLPQSGVEQPTYFFESIGAMVPDRQLDPYYAEFLPERKEHEIRAHVHPGYEFLYLLSGELEVRHGEAAQVLHEQDGVYFDASTPHSYRCTGTRPAAAIIVTMHQPGAPQPVTTVRAMPSGRGSARAVRSAQAQPMRAVVNGAPVEKG